MGEKLGLITYSWESKPGNQLVWFWGCAQPNASRTCVWLRLAGCEGLHLFLGNAPQNGIWSGQKFQANASSLKPHLIGHSWESFKSPWAVAAPCSAFAFVPRGTLHIWLFVQTEAPSCHTAGQVFVQLQFRGSLERAMASPCPDRCVPWHVWLIWPSGFPTAQMSLWLQATALA